MKVMIRSDPAPVKKSSGSKNTCSLLDGRQRAEYPAARAVLVRVSQKLGIQVLINRSKKPISLNAKTKI
jgi:hypothetical protein